MEVEDSSRNSTKPAKKSDNRRRIWSAQEEETLINSLNEIIASGWKSEHDFRIGYLMALEKSMIKAFPGTDLRADPHINSKIHVWKKNFGSLYSMLSRSGFGWNDEANMIVVESEDVWTNYVKTDPNARGLRFKSFPYYHAWCEIFGKDRATGEYAVDCNDVNKQLNVNAQLEDREPEGWNDWPLNGNDTNNDFMSECQASPTVSVSRKKSKSKKRKTYELSDEKLVGLMGTFCDQTNARLGDIAKRIGYEFDVSEKRTAVYDALGKLGELTMTQKIYVAKLLVNNSKDLDLFFSLPDEAKAEMVRMIISGQI